MSRERGAEVWIVGKSCSVCSCLSRRSSICRRASHTSAVVSVGAEAGAESVARGAMGGCAGGCAGGCVDGSAGDVAMVSAGMSVPVRRRPRKLSQGKLCPGSDLPRRRPLAVSSWPMSPCGTSSDRNWSQAMWVAGMPNSFIQWRQTMRAFSMTSSWNGSPSARWASSSERAHSSAPQVVAEFPPKPALQLGRVVR